MSTKGSRLVPKGGFLKPDKKPRQQANTSGSQKKKAPHKK